MRDLFFETVALERIELITRLVSDSSCEVNDKELALEWIAELMADLVRTFSKSDTICHTMLAQQK